MSIWREIWKENLRANREMAFGLEKGKLTFENLLAKYQGDGMLYYALAEAYELKGLKKEALAAYQKAEENFPVEHWKLVAKDTIRRLSNDIPPERYYSKSNFHSFVWLIFQKIYEFVHIDDFVRYVCLSALARASSEWPLTLIDFRTVLELQVDALLETKNAGYDFENTDLYSRINALSYYAIVKDDYIIKSMHWIRKNGNAATHDVKSINKIEELSPSENRQECLKLQSFYEVMQYLNDFNKKNWVIGMENRILSSLGLPPG